jgi:uncharacterized protein YecT (DUF1311 family)
MRSLVAGAAFIVSAILASPSCAQNDLLRGALNQLGRAVIHETMKDTGGQQQRPARVSTHDEIASIQSNLNRLGYDAGPVDGVLGSGTAAAIRAYQSANGLAPTGRVSAALSKALQVSLSGGQGIAPQPAPQPSFNCAKAGTAPERAICASHELAQLDRAVAQAYRARVGSAAQPGLVLQRQRAWLQSREGCGGAQQCLAKSMRQRIAQLGATPPAPVAPAGGAGGGIAAGGQAAGSSDQTAQIVGDDGLLRHASGLLMFPDSFDYDWTGAQPEAGIPPSKRTAEAELRMRYYLAHARVGHFPQMLENRAVLAAAAAAFLPSKELAPYMCSAAEYDNDCLVAGAVILESQANLPMTDLPQVEDMLSSKGYYWWRGKDEFATRHSEQKFRNAGLVQRIIDTAPDTPVKFLEISASSLGDYDFNNGRFTIFGEVGGARLPSRYKISKAFDTAQESGLAVPEDQAEAFRAALLARSPDGKPTFYTAVEVVATPLDSSADRPWKIGLGEPKRYLDAAATIPLSTLLSGGEQVASDAAPSGDSQSGAGGQAGQVLRHFDLRRSESGRVIIHLTYKDPVPTDLEAADYIVAAAHEDLKETFDNSKLGQPILYELLSPALRQTYFACWEEHECKGNYKGFYASSEFEARKLRKTVYENVLPKLAQEAPKFPIPVRQLSDLRLQKYDFDRGGFGLAASPGSNFRIGGSFFTLDLNPSLDGVPEFVKMSPADAETLLSKISDRKVVLQLDYDVETLRLRDFGGPDIVISPVALAFLKPGAAHEVLYRQDLRPDTPEGEAVAPAARLLGPAVETAPAAVSDKQLLGVSVGMKVEAARKALADSFAAAAIKQEGDILSAEDGYCTYGGLKEPHKKAEHGSTCMLMRISNGKVSRIVLRNVVRADPNAIAHTLASRFGKPVVDRELPPEVIDNYLRVLAWGAELTDDRAALGRLPVKIASHQLEAELGVVDDHGTTVVTLRLDPAGGKASNGQGEHALIKF